MLASRELTNEEYALLPCYARAFKCADDEKFSSTLISCKPAYLRFPHDDVNQHVATLTLWNKTNECLELDVEDPKTNVFEAFYDEVFMYGGCRAVIYVQCTPHDRQVCFDTLRIRVTKKNRESDVISVPLQLFPSFSWFSLPKVIVLPHIMIGDTAEITVTLPSIPTQEKFFITVNSPYTDAISISPTHGTLSPQCGDGIKEIVIRYHPKQFITIVHVVQIHFPGVDTAPHDLILFARAIPGLERDRLLNETQEILRWKPKPLRLKIPEPKLIFNRNRKSIAFDVYNILEDESLKKEEDLSKPAGVMHFLLQRDDKIPERKKCVGPLGLTFAQERKLYEHKLKDFKVSLNREEIRQKQIGAQNFKSFLGEDTIEMQQEKLEAIQNEEELHLRQYEQAIGLKDNDPEDLTRKTLELSTQRNLRNIADDNFANTPNYSESEIEQTNEEYRRVIKQMSLRRFKQTVYTVITRYRAAKRIAKLDILKREILRTREMQDFLPKPEDIHQARNIKKMSLSGEVKDDHRHSLQDDELQRLKSLEMREEPLDGLNEIIHDTNELRKSLDEPEQYDKKSTLNSIIVDHENDPPEAIEHGSTEITPLSDSEEDTTEQKKLSK